MTHDKPELIEYAPLVELADAPHSKCGAALAASGFEARAGHAATIWVPEWE